MRPLFRHLAVGVLASTLVACSSSDDNGPDAAADGVPPVLDTDGPMTPLEDQPGTGTTAGGVDGGTSDGDGVAGTPGGDTGTTATGEPGPGNDVVRTEGEENDCSTGLLSRYARTLSEVCSLGGPSNTDSSRTEDAPSAPTGLTALLIADDWVQLDWIPSTDNAVVIAYDIFRDGQLVGTVDDDETTRVQAQRYFRTTTYIDCDYTRFNCAVADGGPGQPQPGTTHEYTVVAEDNFGNRSEASAPLSVTMNTIRTGMAAPDPESEDYTLAFGDEFDGDQLDRDKWLTSLSYDQFPDEGGVVNGEQQFFVDTRGSDVGFPYDPFQFEDGVLKITAERTVDVLPADRLAEARGQPYLSGVISSRSKFEGVRFGYVEMRAKVPSGDGLLSTFFLFQPSANQYEIDILEYLGREPDGATQNYHYRDAFRFADNGFSGVPHASPTMTLDTGVDLSDGFRTYSVLWEEGLVVWYVDGQEVRRMSGPRVADVSLDIVAQFVIGSPNFAGDPSGVDFPVSYEIDYIRAWKR